MVQDLGIHERDASFYSGLLVSAYAIAEAITAPLWGSISDVYGRKPVALIGLAGVAMSSIVFGMAGSFWVALLARFVGGALNGNVAIMQTMVAEMVKNPAHERKEALPHVIITQDTDFTSSSRICDPALRLDSWWYYWFCHGRVSGPAIRVLSPPLP